VQPDEAVRGEIPERYVVVPPWFVYDDAGEGVFYQPKHARARLDGGRTPRQRRPVRPSLVGPDERLLTPLAQGDQVRCPGCDIVHTLDHAGGVGTATSPVLRIPIVMHVGRGVHK
jgi:hypothetical protein